MRRRDFLLHLAAGLLPVAGSRAVTTSRAAVMTTRPPATTTLFLGGDVMIGRGIDQILQHPGDPTLHEPWMTSAAGYVQLAETASGPIPRPVVPDYIWGDALTELGRRAPDARIVNLETAVTRSDDHWPSKGIHYRVHPRNVSTLSAAGIDCCSLANNHVLDWGAAGLLETLTTLRQAGLATAGAGESRQRATEPAILQIPGAGRLLVFAFGSSSSGIPPTWRATSSRTGVWLLDDLSHDTVREIADKVAGETKPGDLVLASIHWGGNWGYDIPSAHRRFAHGLVDRAGVDVVHGHSSHHPLGIEVYRGRPILYGCGDFLNDYEGISGREEYRSDLALAYWPSIDPTTGELGRLAMTVFRVRRFRLERAGREDREWLRARLDREGRRLGTRVALAADGDLELEWSASG